MSNNLARRRTRAITGFVALAAAALLSAVTGVGPTATRVADAATINAPNTPLPAGTYCNQTPTQPTPAGQTPSPADYNGPTKVLHIFEENESASVVNGVDADDAGFELNTLGAQCGVLSNMHGESHPSEPNYLDDTDGGNNPQWALCDAPPNSAGCAAYGAATQISAPSIFSQVESKYGAHGWRVYGQDQTSNCQMTNSADGLFVVRHNPPQYYTGVNCAADDVPAGNWQGKQGAFYSDVVNGTLPAFGMYTPNNTDDGHDPGSNDPPSVNIGNLDTALANVLALIQSGPDYQSGKLIVMVTFDEGTTTGKPPYDDARTGEDCADPSQDDSLPSCQILTYVVGRYVPSAADNDFTTHYSMLKTTQEILGLTPANGYAWLGHAGDMLTNDFYYDFKLAPDSWSTGAAPTPPPPTTPSAPTGVSAAAGDAVASVSFTPPASSGGASISGYTVTSAPGGISASAAHSPVSVAGLTNGTSYTFTVAAVNKFGAGPASGHSNAVTPAAGSTTAPQLLGDPGFESGNGGWTAFTAGTLTRVATPKHGGAAALRVASPNATAGVVGLTQNGVVTSSTAGKTYTASCWVYATSAGLSERIRLLEYTANFASNTQLQQTVATLPANNWTQLQVSAAALRSAERIIPQIYSTNETSSTGSVVYDDCSVTTGLPPSATAPGAPTGVAATAGNASADVAFTAPAITGGAPITGYTVRSTPGGVTATGAGSPITVSGLTNGVAYTFTVTAANRVGPGPASAPSGSVTPTAPPDGAQLLPDPGFESGNGGWTAFQVGTLTRVASPTHAGARALAVTVPAGTTGKLVGLTQNSAVTNSTTGRKYTLSCFVQPTKSGLSLVARLLEYTQSYSSNTALKTTTVASLPIGQWTQVTVSGTAARSGERVIPQIYATNETPTNGSLTYDDCSLIGS
ncbi:fibronectin type III domain-containing protein [uncultured Jatrophihabitans sp.]|uniref:fibronectin type III domain-containing protein n=1 Tax=uncultured Jatrophihabitans sp. TaxID=1610747 RepID=UPI0035CBBB66